MKQPSKELTYNELQQYASEHQDPAVHRYVVLIQDEAGRLLARQEVLERIETSPAGRAAVLRFGAYAVLAVLFVLTFLFGRWFG